MRASARLTFLCCHPGTGVSALLFQVHGDAWLPQMSAVGKGVSPGPLDSQGIFRAVPHHHHRRQRHQSAHTGKGEKPRSSTPKNGKGIRGTAGGGALTASVTEGGGWGWGAVRERSSSAHRESESTLSASESGFFIITALFKGALLTSLSHTSFPSPPVS